MWELAGLAIAAAEIASAGTPGAPPGVGQGVVAVQGNAAASAVVVARGVGSFQAAGAGVGASVAGAAATAEIEITGRAAGSVLSTGAGHGQVDIEGSALGVNYYPVLPAADRTGWVVPGQVELAAVPGQSEFTPVPEQAPFAGVN